MYVCIQLNIMPNITNTLLKDFQLKKKKQLTYFNYVIWYFKKVYSLLKCDIENILVYSNVYVLIDTLGCAGSWEEGASEIRA